MEQICKNEQSWFKKKKDIEKLNNFRVPFHNF